MRPKCTLCHTAKHMTPALILCGCFAWQIMLCETCSDIVFESWRGALGYYLTRWLNKDQTTILSIPARI